MNYGRPRSLSRRAMLAAILAAPAAVVLGARYFPSYSAEEGGAARSSKENNMVTVVEFDDAGERTGVVTVEKVVKTAQEWKKLLSAEQYYVARRKGTERAFTGKYAQWHERGIFRCVCCGTALFSSETKFESGTGWPSFWAPIAAENIRTRPDRSLFMTRTEVECTRCDAHIGHVFDDGPAPTHLRYCMNSAALNFVGANGKAA